MEELSEDGCFHTINDGLNEPIRCKHLLHPSKVDLSKHYLEDDVFGINPNAGILQWMVPQVANELFECYEWFREAAAGDGSYVDLAFCDCKTWKAFARRDGNKSSSAIVIGLGCVSYLVGYANRLSGSIQKGGLDLFIRMAMDEAVGEAWQPDIDPVGILEGDGDPGDFGATLAIVKDTMNLILLHEATHVCRGHMWVSKGDLNITPSSLKRALESDADWGSGFLFVSREYEKLIGEREVSSEEKQNLVSRLIIAAQCQYCVFQIVAKRESDEYHFPFTRTNDTFSGAGAAWKQLFGEDDFMQILNQVHLKMPQLEIAMPLVFPNWVERASAESIADQKSRDHITKSILDCPSIIQQLQSSEAGRLKGARR